MGVVYLLGDKGERYERLEPIPGVFLMPGSDVTTELRGLFPRHVFAALWAKYPRQFGAEETAACPSPTNSDAASN